jgi:hypothetical protein
MEEIRTAEELPGTRCLPCTGGTAQQRACVPRRRNRLNAENKMMAKKIETNTVEKENKL